MRACGMALLGGGGRDGGKQRLGLRQRRLVAHGGEQIAGFVERLLGAGLSLGEQAAAVAEGGGEVGAVDLRFDIVARGLRP